jgi:hypothetical protein
VGVFLSTLSEQQGKGSSDDVLRGIKAKVELGSPDCTVGLVARPVDGRLWFSLRTAGELI